MGKERKKSHVFSSLFLSVISGANSIISCFYLGADLLEECSNFVLPKVGDASESPGELVKYKDV